MNLGVNLSCPAMMIITSSLMCPRLPLTKRSGAPSGRWRSSITPTETRTLGPGPFSSRSTRPIKYSETPRNVPPMTQQDKPKPAAPRKANAPNKDLDTHTTPTALMDGKAPDLRVVSPVLSAAGGMKLERGIAPAADAPFLPARTAHMAVLQPLPKIGCRTISFMPSLPQSAVVRHSESYPSSMRRRLTGRLQLET